MHEGLKGPSQIPTPPNNARSKPQAGGSRRKRHIRCISPEPHEAAGFFPYPSTRIFARLSGGCYNVVSLTASAVMA